MRLTVRAVAVALVAGLIGACTGAKEPETPTAASTPPAGAELVKPADRDPTRWDDARANDGTPFAFAIEPSPSGSKEWVVYLEGGGFCDDNAISCATRDPGHSSTPPGSDGDPVTLSNDGILSRDPTVNPSFHDANFVFAYYVSSDAWTGATTEPRPIPSHPEGWWFTGRANVAATFEVLIDGYGLDDSDPDTKVLFAGSSAGGTGVDANADQVAALLPNIAAADHLLLIDDAGFIFDFDDPEHRPGDVTVPVRDVLEAAHDLWGSEHLAACEADHPGEPSACFFLDVSHPYIVDRAPAGLGLPVLVQTSSLDRYGLDLHHIDDPTDPSDAAAYETWRLQALAALTDVPRLFSGGERPYHTILLNAEAWAMGPTGSTFREVLTRFWDGGPPERVVFGNP